MKLVIPTAIFNVALPLADVGTDIKLLITWYYLGHWKFATAMLVPCLMNYIFSMNAWWRLESAEDKKKTWVFVLLSIWKEYRAVMIIVEAFRNVRSAQRKKEDLVREIGGLEPILEAVPTVCVLLYCFAWNSSNYRSGDDELFGDKNLFFATFFLSLFSGGFGVASFLLNSPFALIPCEGPLSGILTWRFLVAFIACSLTIFSKMCLFIFAIVDIGLNDTYFYMVVLFTFLFLLPSLLSMTSIMCLTGCEKKVFQMYGQYPTILFLPLFTFFTIGPSNIECCSKRRNISNRKQVSVSKTLTITNIVINIVIVVIGSVYGYDQVADYQLFFYVYIGLIFCSATFTVALLYLKPVSCCRGCCYTYCCGPSCCLIKYSHLDLSNGTDGNEVEEIQLN